MRKVWIILFLFVTFWPLYVRAEDSYAGFIPGNIWYSRDTFEEGDRVKIYTAIFNPESRQLYGTVSFFNKNVLLGKKDFVVSGNGVRDVSVDWLVTAGSHIIFARIEDARFSIAPGEFETAYLTRTETVESRRTVAPKPKQEPKGEVIADEIAEKGESISKWVVENTPSFVAKPVIGAVTGIEDFRKESSESDGKISMVFKNKYLFYSGFILLGFVLLRFIWRIIF